MTAGLSDVFSRCISSGSPLTSFFWSLALLETNTLQWFSDVELNMQAAAPAGPWQPFLAQMKHSLQRTGSNRCHGGFSHFVRYAPNISLYWQRAKSLTSGHLVTDIIMDFFVSRSSNFARNLNQHHCVQVDPKKLTKSNSWSI